MAECVAAYRLNGRRVEVWQGDALAKPAGVALFGRCRPLRAQLESLAGKPFEPAPKPTVWGRRFDLLAIDRPRSGLSWRLAVSLGYRPRKVRVDARQTHPNMTHIDKLSDDVWWALGYALKRTGGIDSITLLPLSCRNPEVVAVAETLAIWSAIIDGLPFCGSQASVTFRLFDLADVSPYLRVLENRDGILTRVIEAASPSFTRAGALARWAANRFEPE